jgi:hypothetical protein
VGVLCALRAAVGPLGQQRAEGLKLEMRGLPSQAVLAPLVKCTKLQDLLGWAAFVLSQHVPSACSVAGCSRLVAAAAPATGAQGGSGESCHCCDPSKGLPPWRLSDTGLNWE